MKPGPKLSDPRTRFWEKVCYHPDGCWYWTANKLPAGYGIFGIKEGDAWKTRLAHRISYEWFVGPIPPGLDIDHVCKHKNCVNPAHLEAVTRSENLRRIYTHCKNGHELTEENTDWEIKLVRRCRCCLDKVDAA